jgi:hypothetical protein
VLLGEAVRIGDTLVRYVRAPNDETAAFRLRVVPPADEPIDVRLVPGGAQDLAWDENTWKISHADVAPGEGVTIRRASRSSVLLIAGVTFVAAAFCLLSIRPRREEN